MDTKNKESKLRELQELEFAALDLKLFLDTHPDDEEAIKKLKEYDEQSTKVLKDYEKSETILFSYHVKSKEDMDKWINDPWPWEKK